MITDKSMCAYRVLHRAMQTGAACKVHVGGDSTMASASTPCLHEDGLKGKERLRPIVDGKADDICDQPRHIDLVARRQER